MPHYILVDSLLVALQQWLAGVEYQAYIIMQLGFIKWYIYFGGGGGGDSFTFILFSTHVFMISTIIFYGRGGNCG